MRAATGTAVGRHADPEFADPDGPRPPGPSTPPGALAHGHEGDSRYPSPRALRDALGQTVDILVTVAVGVAAAFAAVSSHVVPDRLRLLDYLIGAAVAVVASFVVRVPVQAALGASPGRLIFGLRAIRPLDGGRVTLADCARTWGSNWLAVISLDQLGSLDVGFAQVRAVDLRSAQ